MEKIKILYLHGYGSVAEESEFASHLRSLGCEVIVPQLDNNILGSKTLKSNIELARSVALSVATKERLDVVIGQSLGGFTAMHLHGHMRLLINPCFKPSLRLRTFNPSATDEDIAGVAELENSLEFPDREERAEVFGLFGSDDELFSYHEDFNKRYANKQAEVMNGVGHRLTSKDIDNFVIPMFDKINKQSAFISYFEENAWI